MELCTFRDVNYFCRIAKETANVEWMEASTEEWREKGGGIVLTDNMDRSGVGRDEDEIKIGNRAVGIEGRGDGDWAGGCGCGQR